MRLRLSELEIIKRKTLFERVRKRDREKLLHSVRKEKVLCSVEIIARIRGETKKTAKLGVRKRISKVREKTV